MSTFIFDELTGLPTILATNRAKRTDQTGAVGGSKDKNHTDKGKIFSKGYENLTPPTLYQDADDWNVRVFKNKYPLVEDHEIVVHSPSSQEDISDFSVEQSIRIIRAFLNRVSYYGSQGKEVLIFNNRGGSAGASILHPHSQVVALKGFPGILEREKESAIKYYNEEGSCYWCDFVSSELRLQKRVVFESPHFVLLVPPACRWSYEMILIPKEHKPNFGFINEREIADFALILKSALGAYDKLFDTPDRNFWIHTMQYEPFHWHTGFLPHLKVLGGLELGAGIWVSDKATPEAAAAELGSVVKSIYEENS
jgi:UDPglucose--hexose-1-phosphate uridylyltransferase